MSVFWFPLINKNIGRLQETVAVLSGVRAIRRRWEDGIRMDLMEIGAVGV
jgi:hypothetical protein